MPSLRPGTVPSHVRRLDASESGYDGPVDKLAFELALTSSLQNGDLVLYAAGDIAPVGGVIIDGLATTDEEQGHPNDAAYRALAKPRRRLRRGTRIVSGYVVIRVADDS